MSLLPILHYPDPRLRTQAKPVIHFDATLHTLLDNMLETMYSNNGIGLAATQVNVHQRVIVMDLSNEQTDPVILINPEIIYTDAITEHEEGCLSIPGIYEPIERAKKITVRSQDKDGQYFEIQADDLLAICIQHEIDHLNGKLFVDYLSSLKQSRIRKKLEKQNKKNIL